MRRLRLAFLTTDNRDHHRCYERKEPYFGPAPEALLGGLAKIPDLEVHVISCTQKEMDSPKIIFNSIFFHSLLVPKWGWLRSGYFGCRRAVTKKLCALKPDLVHAQGTERDCAVSALSFAGPKLLTLHGNIRRVARVLKSPPFSFWWLQARLENWVLPKFDGVICLSHHAESQVSGVSRKSWVVPNAVDSSFFGIARNPVAPPRILCVATINPLKNQLGLCRALEINPPAGSFELRFFGALDPASRYGKGFLQAISRNSSFFYGGLLNRAALRDELSKASALILPTFEENCPMVILEAQAAGVPVIASNVGGVSDLVQDGITGILTDPLRPETMPRALIRLLGDPNLAKKLSEHAAMLVQQNHEPSEIARVHFEVYRSLLGEG